MPAVVSWPRYLTFFTVSSPTCLAGSQVVHLYYRPNLVRLFCCVYFMIHEHIQEIEDLDCKSYLLIYKHLSKVSFLIVCLQSRNLTLYSQDLTCYLPELLHKTFVMQLCIYNIFYKAQRIKSCILYLDNLNYYNNNFLTELYRGIRERNFTLITFWN